MRGQPLLAPEHHLAFGISAAAALNQALRSTNRNVIVSPLPNDMDLGPINPPSQAARRRWYETSGLDEEIELVDIFERYWGKAASLESNIFVWACRLNAAESAGLHELLRRRAYRTFRLVDLTGAQVSGDDGTYPLTSVQMAGLSLLASIPYEQAASLTQGEISASRADWRRLQEEDSPLRISEGERLVSVAIDFFDDFIVSYTSRDWLSSARVVGRAMADLRWSTQPQHVSDRFIWSRVRTLAADGFLEIKGDLEQMHDSFVRCVA